RAQRARTAFTTAGSRADSSRGSRTFTSRCLWLTARTSTEISSSPARARPVPKPVMLLSMRPGVLGGAAPAVKAQRMQPWNKRLEGTGKRAPPRVAARVFQGPAPTMPAGLRRVLLVRIGDRMGEAPLPTPLALGLKQKQPAPGVDVLVHEKTARVL